MTAKQSRVVAAWCLCGGLLSLIVWSYGQLSASRAALRAAADDLEACRQVARQIALLRGGPSPATVPDRSPSDLASRIEAAAQVAGLTPDHIVRIDPQLSRPVGDTAYEEQLTTIQLGRVSMVQLGAFFSELTASNTGWELSSLRLTAALPDNSLGAGDEAWQVEATLSHLVAGRQNAVGKTRLP